jgi:hypothetical protein
MHKKKKKFLLSTYLYGILVTVWILNVLPSLGIYIYGGIITVGKTLRGEA